MVVMDTWIALSCGVEVGTQKSVTGTPPPQFMCFAQPLLITRFTSGRKAEPFH